MPLSIKKKIKKSLSVDSARTPAATPVKNSPRHHMDELKAAFNFFDRNGNGNIEADELGSVMQSLGYKATPEELSEMINEADIDGNHMIDFNEFVQLMEAKSKRDRDQEDEMKEAFKVIL